MDSADYPEMFYARQVINNACGTQALLSVLLNIKDDGVELGNTLKNFQEFATALDAETRGEFCLLLVTVSSIVAFKVTAYQIVTIFEKFTIHFRDNSYLNLTIAMHQKIMMYFILCLTSHLTMGSKHKRARPSVHSCTFNFV